MRYGYQEDKRQKQIEKSFKDRMTFDQAIEYYQYILTSIENKWII